MEKYTISCTVKKFQEISASGVKPDFQKLVSDVDGMNFVEVFGRERYARVEATESAVDAFEKANSEDYIISKPVRVKIFDSCHKKLTSAATGLALSLARKF